MAFLGVYGAHAAGKTTAIHRFYDEIETVNFKTSPKFTIIFADNNNAEYRYDQGVLSFKDRTPGGSLWNGKSVGKRAAIRDCVADDSRVYLVESARFDTHVGIANAHMEYEGGSNVVFVTLEWQTMGLFIQQRCDIKGKTFRADYWTPAKLNYEGYKRYINQAHKYLDPARVPYKVFQIDEQRENWTDVMAHITSLLDRPMEAWYGSESQARYDTQSSADQRVKRERKDHNRERPSRAGRRSRSV